jgi:hypothetical protein
MKGSSLERLPMDFANGSGTAGPGRYRGSLQHKADHFHGSERSF